MSVADAQAELDVVLAAIERARLLAVEAWERAEAEDRYDHKYARRYEWAQAERTYGLMLHHDLPTAVAALDAAEAAA